MTDQASVYIVAPALVRLHDGTNCLTYPDTLIPPTLDDSFSEEILNMDDHTRTVLRGLRGQL